MVETLQCVKEIFDRNRKVLKTTGDNNSILYLYKDWVTMVYTFVKTRFGCYFIFFVVKFTFDAMHMSLKYINLLFFIYKISKNIFWLCFPSPNSSQIFPTSLQIQLHVLSLSKKKETSKRHTYQNKQKKQRNKKKNPQEGKSKQIIKRPTRQKKMPKKPK